MASHAPLVRRCSSKSRLEKQKEVVDEEAAQFLDRNSFPCGGGEADSENTSSSPEPALSECHQTTKAGQMNRIDEVRSPVPLTSPSSPLSPALMNGDCSKELENCTASTADSCLSSSPSSQKKVEEQASKVSSATKAASSSAAKGSAADVSFYFPEEDSSKNQSTEAKSLPAPVLPTSSCPKEGHRADVNVTTAAAGPVCVTPNPGPTNSTRVHAVIRGPLTSSASFDDAHRYLSHPTRMVKQASLASTMSYESSSPALSRDSSIEYTDSTGVDLEEFLKMTLNKCHKDRFFLLKLETELSNFVQKETKTSHKFLPMTSYNRMLVHRVAAFYGLDHNIDNSGKCIVVTKTPNTRIPEFRLKEHLASDFSTDERKRRILKRDFSAQDEKLMLRQRLLDGRRNQSFEEREEHYHKSFSSQEYLLESPHGLSRHINPLLPGGCGSEENLNSVLTLSSGDPELEARLRGLSLADIKSGKVSRGPLPFPPDEMVLVAVHPCQVFSSSLVYSARDGQPYRNSDGSVYRHNPALLPPYESQYHLYSGPPTNTQMCAAGGGEAHLDITTGQFSQLTVIPQPPPGTAPALQDGLAPRQVTMATAQPPQVAMGTIGPAQVSMGSTPPQVAMVSAAPAQVAANQADLLVHRALNVQLPAPMYTHPQQQQLSANTLAPSYYTSPGVGSTMNGSQQPAVVCQGGPVCAGATSALQPMGTHHHYAYHTPPQQHPTAAYHLVPAPHGAVPAPHGAAPATVGPQYVRAAPAPTSGDAAGYYTYQPAAYPAAQPMALAADGGAQYPTHAPSLVPQSAGITPTAHTHGGTVYYTTPAQPSTGVAGPISNANIGGQTSSTATYSNTGPVTSSLQQTASTNPDTACLPAQFHGTADPRATQPSNSSQLEPETS